MFQIDERLRGFPVVREQVTALHQSINAPHLAIPGKQAGPAKAFIIGLRGQTGVGLFIYLYLTQAGDCAIYASDRRTVPPEEYPEQESEALAFVESMGFMMDNLNFTELPGDTQDELVKTLPVFLREPRAASTPDGSGKPNGGEKTPPAILLGRIFSSF